jgi:hypothetical protein
VDEICIAVAEWAKGQTTWGPSPSDEGGTGARPSVYGTSGREETWAALRAGAVAVWG